MKRLKILVIPAWYPSRRNQLAGIFVKEHAKAASLYNDIVILYSEGIDRSAKRLYEIEDNVEEGLRTLRLRYRKSLIPKTSYFIYLWAMFRAFRKLVKDGFKPDVIHAHVYSAGILAVLLGKRYGIPVVISEHFTGFRRGLVRGFEKMKAKFAFEHATLVCPVSEALKEDIERHGVQARFQVVPNAVNTTLFSPIGNKSLSQKERDPRKYLLFVGLLTPKKGLPYLLKALAKLKAKRNDFLLDVIGEGSNRAEYEKLAQDLGLLGNVRFHGFLETKQEVAEFMKRCDFFVLPSLFETFGVVLIEAMACGKPIIATDIGGPNEIVTNEVGQLVTQGDSESLAVAIDYMLDHYHEYMPQKLAEYARSRFGYEAVGKEWDRVYRCVIGGNISDE